MPPSARARAVGALVAPIVACLGLHFVPACSSFGDDTPSTDGGVGDEGARDVDGSLVADAAACDLGACAPFMLAQGLAPASRLTVGADIFYAEVGANGNVMRLARKANSPPQKFVTSVGAAGIGVQGNQLFVTSPVLGKLIAYDTTSATVVHSLSVGGPMDLLVDEAGEAVVLADPTHPGLYVYDSVLNASNINALVDHGVPSAVAMNGQNGYVAIQAPDTVIWQYPRIGGASQSTQPLPGITFASRALDVDDKFVYFGSGSMVYGLPIPLDGVADPQPLHDFNVGGGTSETVKVIASGPKMSFIATSTSTGVSSIYRMLAEQLLDSRQVDRITTFESCAIQDLVVQPDALYVICTTTSSDPKSTIWMLARPK